MWVVTCPHSLTILLPCTVKYLWPGNGSSGMRRSSLHSQTEELTRPAHTWPCLPLFSCVRIQSLLEAVTIPRLWCKDHLRTKGPNFWEEGNGWFLLRLDEPGARVKRKSLTPWCGAMGREGPDEQLSVNVQEPWWAVGKSEGSDESGLWA